MRLPLSQYWRLLSRYLAPQRPRVLLLGVLLLASIGLQLAKPQIVRAFIDSAADPQSTRSLGAIALLFILVSLLQQAVAVGAAWVGENVAWIATNGLRVDLLAHTLSLDPTFYKQHPPGAMIERIDGDVNALSNFFSKFIIDVLGNLALLLGILALLLREDWRVGLGLGLFITTALLTLVRLRSFAVPHWTESREANANFFGFLGEHLDGTEDTRALGAGGYVLGRFHEHLRRWMPINRRAGSASATIFAITLAVFALGNVIAFGLSAYLWTAGAITIGTVYLIFHYTELLRTPIEQIRTQIQDLQRAGASIQRVEELFQTRSRIVEHVTAELPGGPLAVELERVEFGYDPAEPVLDGISLTLAPGRVLGLLGRTGSGKTTLSRLLLRLYDPLAGAVRLGGVDLRDVALADLRGRVGIVTQDVQLVHGTLRDNLTFFDRSYSDARLLEVLDELGLGAWHAALASGLDSELEPGGLSAGEAQLLACARLFLKDPGLVILDEASSRLDRATEQLIERAVARLLQGRTGIIIAHRLATIQHVDEVLLLDHGRVLEHGERERLAQDPAAHFAALLRAGMEEVLA